jgi:hypothetical protein
LPEPLPATLVFPFWIIKVSLSSQADFSQVEDFKLLEKCVEALRSAAQLSPNVSKLHRACRMFFEIAKVYLNHDPKNPTSPRQAQAPPSPAANVPSTSLPPTQPLDNDVDLPDFPQSQADWDGIFNEWEFGLGAANAREMSAFLLSGSSGHLNNDGFWPENAA